MIKLRKKIMTLLLSLLIVSNFACEQTEESFLGHFKQPIDLVSVSSEKQNAIMIVDNLSSQLFLYDLNEKCYLDFIKEAPLENGLILPKYPYKISISDDSNKAVILSSDGSVSVINIAPYLDSSELGCKDAVLPNIEFKKQTLGVATDISMKKTDGLNYEILLIKNKTIEFYNYNGSEMTPTYNKTFSSKILNLVSNENGNFISLEGEKAIVKVLSDGSEELTDLTDISVEYDNINKFLITDDYIFVYSNYESKLLAWSLTDSKYKEIKSSYNPLDPSAVNPSKSLKLSYRLNSMSLFKQEYNIEDGKFLNGLGYLNLHQLLEGNYLLLTDNGGYFYFLTIDTDKSLITKYPEDHYASLEEYNSFLDKNYLELQVPLQTDYKVEIPSITQSQYCTQFNKQEANQCFFMVNEEDDVIGNNRFVVLKEEVNNREYKLDNDYFKFKFESALDGFASADGSLSTNKLNSTSLDFSKITVDAQNLQLEIVSELAEDKLNDSKCEKYKTITDEELEKDDSNRRAFRLVPITAINGHELSLDIANDQNLAYCYEEAVAFQVRLKNLFLVSTTQSGEIGVSSYCTTSKETNPLCTQENNERCPALCSDENTPFYENDLFKVKIFSDKGEMDIDSYINLSIGVSSTVTRYRHSLISPIKAVALKNNKEKQSKAGIAIIDSYENSVSIIDTNDLSTIDRIIK